MTTQKKKKSTENTTHLGVLLVKNIHTLPCKKNYLINIFKIFGNITSINTTTQKKKAIKCILAIRFNLPECTVKAASYLDGKIFFQNILHIFANKKEKKKFNFKEFKKIKHKDIFKNSFYSKNWISALISEHTIVKKMLLNLGYTKNIISLKKFSEVNPNYQLISQGRIQNEMFLFLKKEGINLFSFDPKLINYKSSKTILIKSLTSYKKKHLNEIIVNLEKITKHIVIPFAETIIIEFKKKKKAIKAYNFLKKIEFEKKMAIQWAPLNCHFNSEKNEIFFKNESIQKNKKNKIYKILMRNLPFEINSINLKKIALKFCGLVSIKIPKKKNGKNRGFGFIEFDCIKALKKAFILIQNIRIKKRHIICSIIHQ